MHLKQVSYGFKINHLTFGDKIERVLALHIWNYVPKTLKTESSFQTFKRSLNYWFGPKCKCKLAVIWVINPKVLLQ